MNVHVLDNFAGSGEEAGKTNFKPQAALQAHQEPEIRTELSVEASETVVVTAIAPLLNQKNGSIGDVIPMEEVDNVPLNGRSPTALALLSVGVRSLDALTQQRPFGKGNFTQISISGTPSLIALMNALFSPTSGLGLKYLRCGYDIGWATTLGVIAIVWNFKQCIHHLARIANTTVNIPPSTRKRQMT